MELTQVKEKREKLLEQFNSLQDKRVELEKQLKVVEQDILTFRGAILACNELIDIHIEVIFGSPECVSCIIRGS